ncbi:MAG: hypothetical protein PHW10_06185 [Candidatus Peribacteraceae bacterium]|nr:hypothetical protein [Candidatus Peribacteraceae bacterium]
MSVTACETVLRADGGARETLGEERLARIRDILEECGGDYRLVLHREDARAPVPASAPVGFLERDQMTRGGLPDGLVWQ